MAEEFIDQRDRASRHCRPRGSGRLASDEECCPRYRQDGYLASADVATDTKVDLGEAVVEILMRESAVRLGGVWKRWLE